MPRWWWFGFFLTALSACTSTSTLDDLSLDAQSSKGILVKKVVIPETTDLVVVPVDLEDGTFKEPIVLRGDGAGLIEAASNKSGTTRNLYYAAHFLEPGDYAVLRMGANLAQVNLNIRNTFCYADFSAVISVERGTASLWDVIPLSIQSWQSYSSNMLGNGRKAQEELNYVRSTADLPSFHPTSFKVVPKAFVRFETEDPRNPWRCKPTSMLVEHVVE